MPKKDFHIEGIGTVAIYKRRGQTSIKLSITSKREIRITIPAWAPYSSGVAFAVKQSAWITQHVPPEPAGLQDWQSVGKEHRLRLKPGNGLTKTSTRSKGRLITIQYPSSLSPTDAAVQAVAARASIAALRREAEEILPERLQRLADSHGFSFYGVQVKKLSGRWGSCDSKQLIVLNLFLMQLPWELIDYVLFHELTHTKHMNHGADFWRELTSHLPNARMLRREIRRYNPILTTGPATEI